MKFKNMAGRKSTPILYFLAIILFISFFIIKVDILLISSKLTGDIRAVRKIDKDSYIGILYTHSVQKSETSEWYRVGDDELILMEERYKDQGAGLPVDYLYKFEYYNGGFRLYDINKPFKEFVYRTGAAIANHRLNIDGKEEEFIKFSSPGEALKFEVTKVFLGKYLIWRLTHG